MTDIVNPIDPPVVPPVPQRNDEATFEDRSDAGWEFAFNTLPGYMQDTMGNVHQNAVATNERALAADQRATDAETAKGQAEDARDKAQDWAEGVEPEPGAKSARQWSDKARDWAESDDAPEPGAKSAKTWAGESEAAKDSAWAAAAAAGVSAGLPQPLVPGKVLKVSPAGLVQWGDGTLIGRQERAAPEIIDHSDIGQFIDIVSGSFTQPFDAPGDLGNGWWCYIGNSGTGDITIPASDGRTNWIMYPGEVRLFQCDGVALRSSVVCSFFKVFESSGCFIKPPGYSAFGARLWGAGGGGAKASSGEREGGAGGACSDFMVVADEILDSEPVVIGAGGVGASASPAEGGAGGDSSVFGIVSGGGGGGKFGNAGSWPVLPGGSAFGVPASVPVYGGSPTNNTKPIFGGGGSPEHRSPVFGGASGGSLAGSTAIANGTSLFGGAGGAASMASAGSAGVAPGGGGGATSTGAKAGDGARGELRIWGII